MKPNHIDIVFDGPPSHQSGRFVEVENAHGHGMAFGTWVLRTDGFWVLRIYAFSVAEIRESLYSLSWEDQERVFDRLGVHPSFRDARA